MIKSKLIYFILFIVLLFINNIKAEIYSINFVDIDKIINDSEIGATAISEIENRVKNKYDEFKKIDSDLKQKELEILRKKNLISQEEFNNEIQILRENISNFQKEKKIFDDTINEERSKIYNILLNTLRKVLSDYASSNSISLIVQKSNIIIGKKDLDITDKILKAFNSQKINLN